MPDPNLPETEHFEIRKSAYHRLVGEASKEVIRCLLLAEAPSGLTMEKVRDRIRLFVGSSTEPWARVTDVIRPKTGDQRVPSKVLQREYYRLLRALRDQLASTLLCKEREVWEKACQRMIHQAEYAIFRVTESAVHLHRLTPNRQHQRYA
ncbi:hypothetical protein GGP51_002193 [Salinibacter ruber]|nr:hypothetical protein [Salinibacter ruber]